MIFCICQSVIFDFLAILLIIFINFGNRNLSLFNSPSFLIDSILRSDSSSLLFLTKLLHHLYPISDRCAFAITFAITFAFTFAFTFAITFAIITPLSCHHSIELYLRLAFDSSSYILLGFLLTTIFHLLPDSIFV